MVVSNKTLDMWRGVSGTIEDILKPAVGIFGSAVGFAEWYFAFESVAAAGAWAAIPGIGTGSTGSQGCATIIAFGLWTGPGSIALCAAFYLFAAKFVDVLIFPRYYLSDAESLAYLRK